MTVSSEYTNKFTEHNELSRQIQHWFNFAQNNWRETTLENHTNIRRQYKRRIPIYEDEVNIDFMLFEMPDETQQEKPNW